jgi:hydroperoxide dehydratase
MPPTKLTGTGSYIIVSYLNPTEPKHGQLKHNHFIPEFYSSYRNLYDTLENELAKTEKVIFTDANYQTAFKTILQKHFPELTLPKQISELVFQKKYQNGL